MRMYLWNIMLALVWAAMAGSMTLANLVVGFVLAYFVLMLAQPVLGRSGYFTKVGQTLRFLVWFLWELFLSNVRVAYDVATPGHLAKPGILAIPLDAETPFEITLFANLITLTPGTLSLDVSSDNKTLYIHAMYIDDPDTLRREIKEGLEKRLLELLR